MSVSLICGLCPKSCRIPEGEAGDCRVRVNIGGKLRATTYGRPSAVHVDPIEKKPLFHFLPGSGTFSIATAGCNLHCKFCQNWELSQRDGTEMEVRYRADPPQVVAGALQTGCRSIAYTYSDPVVFYEYTADTAALARDKGLQNVLVTAGYITPGPLRRLCKVVDASNTDLKYFDDGAYRRFSDATLKPVLDALVIQKEEGVWLEVTNLIVPTLNDDPEMIRKMCRWMVKNLGPDTPLHFSRFFPMFKLQNLPPTPVETLLRAREEGLAAGLRYVYVGNLHGGAEENTRCPSCRKDLVRRIGYQVLEMGVRDGRCRGCGAKIAGRWGA